MFQMIPSCNTSRYFTLPFLLYLSKRTKFNNLLGGGRGEDRASFDVEKMQASIATANFLVNDDR